jgi:hypothetical protein
MATSAMDLDLGAAAIAAFVRAPSTFSLRHMVEVGGIGKGIQATAAENMDGTMIDCGGGGAGAGQRMVETDGKGLLMLAHIKTAKK